ncbi:hypothetical protein [Prauserella marina]|uniref:hypothetical protein n=1 Tax=Prauserella marina TaxID=530584 RepID=UPI001474D0BC|nr:hypothetical protein [Prauserella marina]
MGDVRPPVGTGVDGQALGASRPETHRELADLRGEEVGGVRCQVRAAAAAGWSSCLSW